MSELKFACPVCGQHITADSSTSGGRIECPTCFQQIVVPQAPASADSKFILSATQVGKPRPSQLEAAAPAEAAPRASDRHTLPILVTLLVLLCAAGAAVLVFRDRVSRLTGWRPRTTVKLPAGIAWSLELTNATFPGTNALGRIHGEFFTAEHARLEGSLLSLRQGKGWPPDLGVSISLAAQPGEEWADKTVEIGPDQPPPVPHLTLRWKNDQQQPAKQDFGRGYVLKLAFGQPAHGHLPGKIYLSVPDETKSVVAGTFDAELRRPKPSQPKGPKTKG